MAEPFLGQIQMFAFNFPPRAWALCDGQALPISQNTAVFSLLGTIYGGDGRTTFRLPDLRGRVPAHQGTGPGLTAATIGRSSGSETQTLVEGNLPPHSHSVQCSNGPGGTDNPQGAFPAQSNEDVYSGEPNSTMGATQESGSGTAFDIRQPELVVSFAIALQGIFPSRS